MSIELEDDDDVVVPEIGKGPSRNATKEKSVKYEVTDGEGDTWQEYLTHAEVCKYHNEGYTLDRVYFWQFWR